MAGRQILITGWSSYNCLKYVMLFAGLCKPSCDVRLQLLWLSDGPKGVFHSSWLRPPLYTSIITLYATLQSPRY